jgi:ParB family transcriptional regulator, chromosome partitioning protein
MSEQTIPIAMIRPPTWNSRLPAAYDTAEIDGLAASMHSEGQLNAVNVEGPDSQGMYNLIAGSRRMRAAASIGWTDIRANVSALTDEASGIVKNIVENLQRKDLSLFEQARACSKLRDEKLKLKDITVKTGLSEQYVSNLVTMYNKLPSLVNKAWAEGHEVATFNFLRDLTSIKEGTPEATAEKQLARWQERTELYQDFQAELQNADSAATGEDLEDEQEKKKKVKSKTNGAIKLDGDTYDALFAAVKNARLPGTALALSVLKVVHGDQDKIKGVYPEPTTKSK